MHSMKDFTRILLEAEVDDVSILTQIRRYCGASRGGPSAPSGGHCHGDDSGTPGNDTLQGTNDPDTITGAGGNDRISGEGGSDCIDGGSGDDVLFGDAGEGTALGSDASPLVLDIDNLVSDSSSGNNCAQVGDVAVYSNVATLEDGTPFLPA